ncbi:MULTISPECIES: hypothetical protein [unclassified Streptomyces]|uniref:hypothetical protein n=1 Tax=unclassified Streptomyces TaxID=2593676 RepID=UPI00225B6783|nr:MULTISPECIES: hypothetical protein [unclassified Streptomyces]MCX5328275.1 hypothetical protein [Streptomyces sp. NBC_00140]MCX5357686.1 hypothetical protein [Streptomyces sp. NBC_00124]
MSSEEERPEDGSGERESAEGDGPEENRPRIQIGNIAGGSSAYGSHASVFLTNPDTGDLAAREFLATIRELRADLSRLRATDGLMALGAMLADIEAEVSRTGGVSRHRLLRLREELVAEQELLGVSITARAVAQVFDMLDRSPWTFPGPPDLGLESPGRHRSADPAGHTPPGPSPGSDDDEWPETDG